MKWKILCLTMATSTSLVLQSFAFSDVLGTEWYAEYVQTLNNRNIINGYEDGTFRADDNITNGEVLKILITSLGQMPYDAPINSHWATGFLNKAISLGVNIDPTINLEENATRYFVAEMMLEILNADTINISSPFVDIDDDVVNTLYELGVVEGEIKDNKRYFHANNEIKRSEVMALVVRTIDIYDKGIASKEYEHAEITISKTPTTVEDFKNLYLYMLIENETQYTAYYPDINFYDMRDDYKYHVNATSAFYKVFDEYPEYFTFSNQLSAPMGGTTINSDIEISLSSSYFGESKIIQMKDEFFQEVADIWYVLRLNGSINNQMNERQKAEVFFEWIVINNEYDLSFAGVSYTAYGITEYNKAVCQGYVALFNALCKMEGIDVWGVSGSVDGTEHIWSVAVLDGEECYIDPTFADPVPNKAGYCNFSYFDISETQLRTTHTF